MEYPHRPVLVNEAVKYLVHVPDGVYVDGTVGTGGHSEAIGKSLDAKGRLVCLDRDPDAVSLSKKRLGFLGNRVSVIRTSYAHLDNILKELNFKEIDGVFLDLGMSSFQLESSGRGFSFTRNEPLDMRMDPDDEFNAADLVNNLSLKDLEKVLRDYGEENRAKLIARAIVSTRIKEPIKTSLQLALLVKSAFPSSAHLKPRHPATRTFQAFRIAVNRELENLETFLNKAPSLIAERGRLVVLSYHSLEDRLVKQAMSRWEGACSCPPDFPQCVCGKVPLFRRLFKKGLKPSLSEVEENPSSRSAVLRAAERI